MQRLAAKKPNNKNRYFYFNS